MPVWLDGQTLGYFRELPDRVEFRAVDLVKGEDRFLAEVPPFSRILGVRRPGADPAWIAAVELPERMGRASPGEWIRKRVELTDPAGALLSADGVPLRWSVDDTSVVDPDAGEGWMRVRAEGETVLRVDAGGWRGDSVRLRSRPPEARDLAPALAEDWSGGLDTARWIPMGDPLPTVVETEGPFPRAFLSRGDENYASGAVLHRPLRAADGLTVEVWGRVPITSPYHQNFAVALLLEIPAGGEVPGLEGGEFAYVHVSGLEPDSMVVGVGRTHARVPLPDSVGGWHRYTLQVDTAGRLSVLVDGRVHWRWPGSVPLESLDGSHLALHGRSLGTRILHGPVTVWEGVRYRLP